MSIEQTLEERGNRYGSFLHHAEIAQKLQDVIRGEAGWANLASDQKQALTVIADKIARMLNGDPEYRDNWHDIVGYAKLVDDRMAAGEATLMPENTATLLVPFGAPDADGWYEWNGDESMRPAGRVEVEYTFQGNQIGIAEQMRWSRIGVPSDITKWRPVAGETA